MPQNLRRPRKAWIYKCSLLSPDPYNRYSWIDMDWGNRWLLRDDDEVAENWGVRIGSPRP
jgi:hypothetical protein